MKKQYSPLYFISVALKSLWRNRVMSLASVAVLTSCLIVMGGFSLLVVNINVNLEQLGLLKQIVAFADFDATEEEIDTIERQIWSFDNVHSVTHVTKEQSLEDMKMQSEEYAGLFDDIGGKNNPLSDYFVIEYDNVEGLSDLTFRINQIDGVRKLNQRQDLATRLENLKNGVLMIFIWFLIVLLVISVFIIINTIKLSVFTRRNEITVMRYVGATSRFVAVPFVLEGTIIGIISGTLGFFVEWYIYHYIEKMVLSGELAMVSVLQFSDIGYLVLAGCITVGVVTGIFGSVVSLGKYLKV